MTHSSNIARKEPRRVLLASNFWHNELIEGVLKHAADLGWHVNVEMLISGIFPNDWKGDGIIAQHPRCLRSRSASRRCPAVLLNLADPDIKVPRVGIDNHAAGEIAAQHLLSRRFSNFAYYAIDWPASPVTDRFTSYRQCIEAKGYRVIGLRHPVAKRSNSWSHRIRWLRKKIRDAPKPLAVFAVNDRSAADVAEACQAESIRIPNEVAILGMLDIALYRRATGIPLSSITVDFDKHASIACNLLERMMNGKEVESDPIIIRPTGIASRASTDTIATHIPQVSRAIQFMQNHYQEAVTMPQIARAAGNCYSKLCRQFAEDLGESPHVVLCKIRLEFAKRVLVSTDDTLAGIAETCGFGDRVNLHRNFMRYEHCSPGAYRKQHPASS